jgi:hypothetical protein
MLKRYSPKKEPSNRSPVSVMSVDPQNPDQIEEQAGSTSSETFTPAYEEIQMRAYLIHNQKGGSDLENWLEAERVLIKEHREKKR